MSHPDPRPPAADGERALPEEIVKAIEAFEDAAYAQITKGSRDADAWCEAAKACNQARDTLTTSILSRLTAAEAGREEAEARVEKLEKALAPFVAHADRYADWLRKAIAPNPSVEAFDTARSALAEAQP